MSTNDAADPTQVSSLPAATQPPVLVWRTSTHRAVPEGTALCVDLSGPMLDLARSRADGAGIANATLVTAEAQTHPFAEAPEVVARALDAVRSGLEPYETGEGIVLAVRAWLVTDLRT